MRGDTTRDGFRSGAHYRSVLQQQGRVALDAEWNEQRSIEDHLRHAALRDVLGGFAAPLDGGAFALTGGATVTLGRGRCYLDGILVENDADPAVTDQPHLPAGCPVFLAADGSALGAPTAGTYLAELDVSTHLVTALEDPAIREVAVPVPDTTTRAQTVWQVRMLRVDAVGAGLHCGDPFTAWTTLREPTTGRLRARAQPGEDVATPCEVPADAGYRGADNQHYRVEIHEPGDAASATFKWSRENASVQARWVGQSGNRLTVATPARDVAVGFAPDDWLELVDDRTEADQRAGVMVQVDTVHDDVVEIRPATVVPAGATVDLTTMGPHARVRRWEAAPAPTNGSWLALERGVEVDFENGRTYRTGEYWSLPARTALNDLLWPKTAGVPDWARPAGPEHRYAKLALLEYDGTTWTLLEDCRALFPPLTGLVTMRYAGGDGQEATPDLVTPTTLVQLAAPLRVAVANGSVPLAGRPVEFAVTAGTGQVVAGAGPAATVVAHTGADGVAEVTWQVDSATATPEVTARLQDTTGADLDVPVRFTASLLTASRVSITPSACPGLAGSHTVQEALESLCATSSTGCATVVVTPGGDWSAGIRALAPGTSATICFRPGTYPLEEALVLKGLVSVLIRGAGVGSEVVIERAETALRFEGCGSVVLQSMAVTSRTAEWPGPGEPGRGGTVSAVDCGSVSVLGSTLTCAGGVRRSTACLTVASSPLVLVAKTRSRVVVRDSSLVVGHLQDGVVVVDGTDVRVSDCTIAVRRKPLSLGIGPLLTDADRLRRLVGRLVPKPLLHDGTAVPGPSNRLQLDKWRVAFDSVASKAEWADRIRVQPPVAADLDGPDTVRAYLGRLAESAVEQPDAFPAYTRWAQGLRGSVGDQTFTRLFTGVEGKRAIRSVLLGGGLEAIEVVEAGAATSGATVRLGTAQVSTPSPVNGAAWSQALRAHGVVEVAGARQLRNAMYDVARRVLTDAAFRDTQPVFRDWFRGLVDDNPAVMSTGVLVVGEAADDVRVSGTVIRGALEGVHAGFSGGPVLVAPRKVRSLEVRGNEVELALPIETERGQQAVFVGNVDRLDVRENTVTCPGTARGEARFASGVRVHGVLGPRLAIADNHLDHASVGVQVTVLSGEENPHRWYVRDNVCPAAAPAVVAPQSVEQTGNVGR